MINNFIHTHTVSTRKLDPKRVSKKIYVLNEWLKN